MDVHHTACLGGGVIGASWTALFLASGRFVLGYPFNPPHLIPLVEVAGNDMTARFYESVGKTTIRLNKEVPGHVANRLQAAVWREAISLVLNGVASVEDVDNAMWAGPGLRWAAMGPNMLSNLGAGAGGLRAFCDHFAVTFNGCWDDLGQARKMTRTRSRTTPFATPLSAFGGFGLVRQNPFARAHSSYAFWAGAMPA